MKFLSINTTHSFDGFENFYLNKNLSRQQHNERSFTWTNCSLDISLGFHVWINIEENKLELNSNENEISVNWKSLQLPPFAINWILPSCVTTFTRINLLGNFGGFYQSTLLLWSSASTELYEISKKIIKLESFHEKLLIMGITRFKRFLRFSRNNIVRVYKAYRASEIPKFWIYRGFLTLYCVACFEDRLLFSFSWDQNLFELISSWNILLLKFKTVLKASLTGSIASF